MNKLGQRTKGTWALWTAQFIAYMFAVVVGDLLLPAGALRYFWWPIIAGSGVALVSLALRRRHR